MAPLCIALLVALLAAPLRAGDVTVFAAASLKTALDEVAVRWEAETGHRAAISYAGSAALAKQIMEAAPADIYISAASEWMDVVEAEGLLRPGTRRDILGNRLVLIAHGTAEAEPVDSIDLVAHLGGERLSMGQVTSVPAGQYGQEALVNLGLWEGVKDSVAQSENVRIALQLVALGEAPRGIVFASDAVAEPRVSVIAAFPASSHSPIVYPAAVLKDAPPEADAFLAYLATAPAEAVFKAQGFLVLDD